MPRAPCASGHPASAGSACGQGAGTAGGPGHKAAAGAGTGALVPSCLLRGRGSRQAAGRGSALSPACRPAAAGGSGAGATAPRLQAPAGGAGRRGRARQRPAVTGLPLGCRWGGQVRRLAPHASLAGPGRGGRARQRPARVHRPGRGWGAPCQRRAYELKSGGSPPGGWSEGATKVVPTPPPGVMVREQQKSCQLPRELEAGSWK